MAALARKATTEPSEQYSPRLFLILSVSIVGLVFAYFGAVYLIAH